MAWEDYLLHGLQNIVSNWEEHINARESHQEVQMSEELNFSEVASMVANASVESNESHEGTGNNESSQQTEVVDVSSEGSFDAAGKDYIFHFAEGNYTYQIQDFEHGDALVFPEGATPTVVNSDFSDGKIEIQWAANGNVIKVDLTGLSSDIDSSLLFMSDFEFDQTSGGYTLPEQGNSNEGSGESNNELFTETIPVNGSGSYTASDDVAETFQFTAGNYDYTIENFDLQHDVLDLPEGANPTVINDDFSDGEVTVQWAANGNVINVHLVGLTQDEDSSLLFASDLGNALA